MTKDLRKIKAALYRSHNLAGVEQRRKLTPEQMSKRARAFNRARLEFKDRNSSAQDWAEVANNIAPLTAKEMRQCGFNNQGASHVE